MRQKAKDMISAHVSNANKVLNIERSIYNFTIDEAKRLNIVPSWSETHFCHIYAQKYMDIIMHLQDGPMVEMITEQNISTKDVARMTPQEMYPEKWKPDVDVDQDQVVEGIFQCKKCGSKRTTYYSLQTRSSDEPMTNFITCVDCLNRWKM